MALCCKVVDLPDVVVPKDRQDKILVVDIVDVGLYARLTNCRDKLFRRHTK